jgi:hypothetical protein
MHGTKPGEAEQQALAWRRFGATFIGVFAGGLAVVYLFIALIDPYHSMPLSLPMERPLVSISQRYMYPQIVRSGRFDGVVVGSSTSRLIDPQILNPGFGRRFANLSMDSMTAWEQQQLVSLFVREAGAPKSADCRSRHCLVLAECRSRSDHAGRLPRMALRLQSLE